MTFEQAVEHVLVAEGGYVWNEKDPGGETNFGISKRSYPNLDIKNLTRENAKAIYHSDFWMAVRCDELPKVIQLCMFDCAVNQGVDQAIKILQSAVGSKADGKFGPVTMRLVNSRSDFEILNVMMKWRLDRYAKLATWPTFGAGWTKRLLSVMYASLTT